MDELEVWISFVQALQDLPIFLQVLIQSVSMHVAASVAKPREYGDTMETHELTLWTPWTCCGSFVLLIDRRTDCTDSIQKNSKPRLGSELVEKEGGRLLEVQSRCCGKKVLGKTSKQTLQHHRTRIDPCVLHHQIMVFGKFLLWWI